MTWNWIRVVLEKNAPDKSVDDCMEKNAFKSSLGEIMVWNWQCIIFRLVRIGCDHSSVTLSKKKKSPE